MYITRCSQQPPVVVEPGISWDEMVKTEGVYRMVGDIQPADRLIVIRSQLPYAPAVFWWIPSRNEVQNVTPESYESRRFVKTNDKLVIDVVYA